MNSFSEDQLEEIIDYWADPSTQELIKCASPIQKKLDNGQREEESHFFKVMSGLEGPLVEAVKDADLQKYPYQSVGKIFWENENSPPLTWASAFYIGNNTIVTTAHTFDKNRFGMFIPAMRNLHDFYGENYGCYIVNSASCTFHTLYNPVGDSTKTLPLYDICAVQLQAGYKLHKRGNKNEKDKQTIESQGLIPIPLGQCSENEDIVMVLGYPSTGGGKMIKVLRKLDNTQDDVLKINFEIHKGTSGGPWISVSSMKAIGLMGASNSYGSVACKFSADLFKEVGLLKSYNIN